MQISYDSYRIFYYTAKYHSFTKAAKVLHNCQPNISRIINNLEAALECRLFVRNTKGVFLTSEGERLYTHVAAAVERIEAGEQEILSRQDMRGEVVSIGISETALHGLMLPVLSRFHIAYPGVRLKIVNHSTLQATQALRKKQIDFAVVTTPVENADELEVIPLKDFSDLLVGGTQTAALSEREYSLRELADYPFICLSRGTATYAFCSQLFAKSGLSFQPDIEVTTADQILPLVIHNLGISFIPDVFAEEALRNRTIYHLPLKERIPKRQICLLEENGCPSSVAAQVLKKIILQENQTFIRNNKTKTEHFLQKEIFVKEK